MQKILADEAPTLRLKVLRLLMVQEIVDEEDVDNARAHEDTHAWYSFLFTCKCAACGWNCCMQSSIAVCMQP